MNEPKAAYIHIPFCISKCWYCDFNSYPGLESIFDDYVYALIREIRASSGNGLDSVYFGGGTPTILAASELSAILDAIQGSLGITNGAEVTIEANPGTVDEMKLSQLRNAGFNRLSIGVQSFDDEFLSSIGRAHTRDQARDAYRSARQAGFDNVGIDLIFALPGQSLAHWSNTLDTAIELNPEHISLYELSIEEGTRFSKLCAEGKIGLIDEDVQIEMYELAIRKLTSVGYEHYEVSNFAKLGYRSRHNMVYWLNQPYFGFGAGATSYVSGTRSRRIADPMKYLRSIDSGSDAIEFSETLNPHERLGETVVQGLRMLEGIDLQRVQRETDFDIPQEFPLQITSLTQRGLLEIDNGHLRVTHNGLLLLNDVSREFV